MEAASALSLFSGIGGLDLGARAAGVNVRLGTDIDERALASLKAAQPVRTLQGDLAILRRTGSLEAEWGRKGGPTLILGGPPCTPFSHAGFWMESKRRGHDPAASLPSQFLDVVRDFQPAAFILENVPGLAFSTHKPLLDGLIRKAKSGGYRTTVALLNAADFGIPQARKRLFVVGTRKSGPVDLDNWPVIPRRASGWALESIPHDEAAEPDERIRGEYADLLRQVPLGGNYLHFTNRDAPKSGRFKYRGRYWSFLLKLDPRKPSPTIPAVRVTYNGPFHWANRHLRIREIARLQGFPDGYPIDCNLVTARRHLGNAVPPALGAAVVWRVLVALGFGSDMPAVLAASQDPNSSHASVTSTLPSGC